MKNLVICAYKQVGKTTLAKKILDNTNKKVVGFFTRKFPGMMQENQCPVYIFKAGEEPIFDDDHLVGLCGGGNRYTNIDVFNKYGVEYLRVPKGEESNTLILMDEVGFLETKANAFRKRVIECLSSNIPTIVMMKQAKNEPFMKEIMALSDIEFIDMDENNRDEVTNYVLEIIKNL